MGASTSIGVGLSVTGTPTTLAALCGLVALRSSTWLVAFCASDTGFGAFGDASMAAVGAAGGASTGRLMA